MMETGQVNKTLVDVTRLGTMLQEVLEHLRMQQAILQRRGFQLPSSTMDELASVYQEIERIRQALGDQQPELAQLRALVRTMSHINSKLDLSQVLNDVMDTFIEFTGAERGFILLRNPATGEMEFTVARGMDRDSLTKKGFTISSTIVRDVSEKGMPVITTNALEDQRYSAQESIISYAVRSIICVPLKLKEQIVGVAYSDHRFRQELFGEQELKFLMGFVNQAAIAIENARLFEDVQRQLREIDEIKRFLDNVFISIASGVITLDESLVVMTINRAAEHILGIDADQSQGRYYTEIFPALYEGFGELLEAVRSEGHQQTVEINPVLPERGAVNLNLKLSPLRDADNIMGVAIVIDDLTALKQHDETLRVVNTYLSEEMVAKIHDIDNLGLGGEERLISALFADVRGFTTFSESLPPETLMSVINKYLAVSSDAIQVTQGIIDKFLGDAVLGIFNTQLNPQEDHALRCVRAAMTIQYEVEALHQVLPPEQRLKYGIGIHTGAATLGNVGSPSRKEFTAVGEAVVYAKKLQETALGGEIIISESTWELVRGHIECEMVERQLRGETEYRRFYKVLSLKH
ncbi:MAG: GAF domain-containing protein [Anaerolineae bacterium]|nr:GAF domain-containing protein [Anaerolineae bacterium]